MDRSASACHASAPTRSARSSANPRISCEIGSSIPIVAVIPFKATIAIRLCGNVRGEASLRELLFELLPNPWLLVWICDLLVGQERKVTTQNPRRSKCDVSGRRSADIEVLMVPLVWRSEDSSFMPGDDGLIPAWRPYKRIPFSGWDDDHAARSVPVGHLIAAWREDGHVSTLASSRTKIDRGPPCAT